MDVKTTGKIEIAVDHKCLLGEGPVWDINSRSVYWVDILNGEIHEYIPSTKIHKIIPVSQMIGSLALCTNDKFIVALQNGFAFMDKVTGGLTMIADPESHLSNNRFNDGKCDPAGRFFAGTMSFNEDDGAGSLYVLEGDLSHAKCIENVTVSNGMAWSLDHRKFFYIDSPTSKVVAYDYDERTGNISNKSVLIEVPVEDGHPDGMTIDNEGMLWIAHWDGWQVTRWDPVTGKKLSCIKLPVSKVTSCTFGGDTLEDLYITSASTGLTEAELKMQPYAGALFVLRNSGFKGMPAFKFGA